MLARHAASFVIGRSLILLMCLILPGGSAIAHDFGITPVRVVVDDARVEVTLALHPADLLPCVLADESGRDRFRDMAELRSEADAIRRYIVPRVLLSADGTPIELTADPDWPPADLAMTRIDSTGREVPAYLPLTLTGRLPAAAGRLGMTYRLYGEGEFVPLFDVVIVDPGGSTRRTEYLKVNQKADIDLQPYREHTGAARSGAATVIDFLRLGFTHILPLGLDHILFVLGLFLLGGGWRTLASQVTAFTLAHSLTLALAMLNVIRLPSRVVEPVIALSIAYVAVENLFRRQVNRRRWFIVFAFGLVHGLGFAGVLEELGLPPGQFLPALIGFNLGVEAGQLTVLALAAIATWPLRHREWYRPWVVRPACLLIAGVGLFWAVERVLG